MDFDRLQQGYDNADTPWDQEDDDKCEDCGQKKCVCAQLDRMDD
jgi:hypothetical protein